MFPALPFFLESAWLKCDIKVARNSMKELSKKKVKLVRDEGFGGSVEEFTVEVVYEVGHTFSFL